MNSQTTDEGSTKTVILQKAEQLFAQRGYDGVSMRDIAEACHITKANIYYYFKDKASLYRQVLESDMLQLIEGIRVSASGAGTAHQRLTAVADTFARLMREKQPLVQMSMRQFGEQAYEFHELVRRYRRHLLQPVEQVLEDGVRSGELRVQDVHTTALLFIALLRVVTARDLDEKSSSLPEADGVCHAVTLLFDGIRAR